MSTLKRLADKMADRMAPAARAEATWWVKDTRCVASSSCSSRAKRQQYMCWDSSFCSGWQDSGCCS
ncbi:MULTISPECIES: hypothetical protein [unclassified Streptomyces]|uniref:hypothetical protein n=1 Tax=unclassified Streptomyces TaxID=2593676 RepID=UPI0036F885E4